MRKIKFVYFDVGDVLISNDIAHQRLAKQFDCPKEHVSTFFDSHWEKACRDVIEIF